MDINGIMKQLPHRYPFLLVDRVLECTPGESIRAIKNVTVNEPFFPGHFPVRPVMPGVLILEAMAQASGLLAFATQGQAPDENTIFYFVGVDGARFKRPVGPGDQLELSSRIVKMTRGVWKFETRATVAGELAAQAEIMCAAREIADD
jgi:3-hydroxyacyl-[acyl-carrier-protein] dehydratase